jgi:hypothetical protein
MVQELHQDSKKFSAAGWDDYNKPLEHYAYMLNHLAKLVLCTCFIGPQS